MDNQPQVQPDFGYIINQPGPDGGGRGGKKNTRLVLIFAALALLIIVIVSVLLVIASNKKVANTQAATKAETVNLHIKLYFGFVNNNQSAEAYALLSNTAKARISQDDFGKNVVPIINENVDLTACNIQGNLHNSGQSVTQQYICDTKDGKYKVVFTVQLTLSNNEYMIDGYEISSQTKA
jgi:hypothetical protein